MGEKMLQENDLRNLRADINEVAKIGVYHVNLITGESFWDFVLKDIFEVPQDFQPFQGASDQFFPDPEQLKLKHATYQKSIENRTPFEMEFQIVTAKGNHKYVKSFGDPTIKDGECIAFSGGLMDVTGQKQTEHDLMQIKEQWDMAEDIAQIGYWQWNIAEDHFKYSDKLRETYGIKFGTRIDLELILSKVHEDDRQIVLSNIKEFLKTKQFNKFTYRICPKEGETRFLQAYGKVISNSKGQAIEMVGTTQDITENLSQQQDLSQKNQLLSFAEELSNLGHWIIDLEKGAIEWSDTLYRLYDEELGSKITYESFLQKIHPEDRQTVIDHTRKAIKTGKKQEFIHRVYHQDGSIHYLKVIGKAITNEHGWSVKLTGITMDITQDVLRTQELETKNEQLSYAEKLADFGFFQLNVQTGEAQWSRNTYRIFDIPLEETITYEQYLSKVHPNDLETVQSTIESTIQSGIFTNYTHRTTSIDNKIKTVEILGEVTKDKDGKTLLLKGTVNDITEKATKEKELMDKNQQLKTAEIMSKIGNWKWNLATRKVIWSDNLYEIYGHPKEKPLSYEEYLSYIHEEDYAFVKGKIDEAKETGVFEKLTYRIRLRNGNIKTISSTGTVICDVQGKYSEMIGTCQDVTEQVLKERELEEKNLQLNFAEEMAGLGYWSWNVKTDNVKWSDNVYRIFKKEMNQEIRFNDAFDRTHPDDIEPFQKFINEIFKTKTFKPYQYRIVLDKGEQKHVEIDAQLTLDENGEITHISGTVHDITQRIKDQEEKERKNQLLVLGERISKMGHWRWFPSTNKLEWSDNIYLLYNEKIGTPVDVEFMANRIHPEDVPKLYDMMTHCLEQKSFKKWTHRIIHENGFISTIEINGELIFDPNGNIIEVFGTGQDITEQIQKERELKHKNQQLIEAEKIAKIGHWIWNLDSGIAQWSDNLYEIHGFPKDTIITIEKYINSILAEDREMVQRNLENIIATKKIEETSYRITLPQGDIKTIRGVGKVVLNNSGEVTKMIGTCQDISDQVSKEHELLEKNRMMEFAEEISGIGYWKWNLNDDVMEKSNNLLRILDFDQGTSMSFPLYLTRVHPKDIDIVIAKAQEIITEKKFDKFRHRIIKRNGSIRTIELLCEVIIDKSGQVSHLIGTSKDITDSIENQQELIQQNQLLNLAEELSGIGHWKWSQLREHLELSHNFNRMLDIEQGEKLNYDDFMLRVHPEDRELITKKVFQILNTRKFEQFSHRIVKKSGAIKHLEVVGDIFTDENGVVEIIGSAQDVTERRMAEIKFRGLLESAPDAMIITDHKGHIEIINKQAELLLGYSPDELKGRHITTIYPKKFRTLHDEYAKQFVENPSDVVKIQNKEIYILTKSGQKIPIILSFGPVETAEGILVSIAIKDITQRKKAEERILVTNKKLKENSQKLKVQNKQLSDFNQITSHNLRAPVSNLDALIDLYRKEKDAEKKAILFSKFEKVIDHLSSTLDTLVETLRIKSETAKSTQNIRFKQVLQKTKEILTAEILNSGATFHADFSKAKEINYNDVYLESIFLNLVSNAIKYRSEERPPVIEIMTIRKDDKTKLIVKDNGLGIDLKRYGSKLFGLNKVFHRHPQAKGIGLFLTKAQVEAMGGSISVESEVGTGTTFNINLD
ncbi:PAS domain S-box-containing protein [Flavobacteriaceae bacterium MAR_2009_75]|nr:PAS domain S-box-containing protein [Flavobacteriaceae bacterium MAR_2009_75]